MSRRSKLDLSAGKDHEKEQAPGFEIVTDDASETSTAAAEEQPESITPEAVTLESAAQAKDEPLSEGTDKLPSEGLDWLSGKQVVRALLVVGLTAVALYLLKRRFF